MLTWKKIKRYNRFALSGVLGKVGVFSVFYDGCRSKDDPKKYKLDCNLPGYQHYSCHFETEEKAKNKACVMLTYWLKSTGLAKSEKCQKQEKEIKRLRSLLPGKHQFSDTESE